MSPQDRSVSEWIEECRCGDDEAAARLWEWYFRRMVGLARARLQVLRRKAARGDCPRMRSWTWLSTGPRFIAQARSPVMVFPV